MTLQQQGEGDMNGVSSSLSRGIEGSNQDDVVFERRLGELGASSHHNNKHTPLTVFARHKVQPGKEEQFQVWVREISSLQVRKYKGFLGAEIVRPTCCDSNEHVSIFRYDNYEHLQVWMDSEERRTMLEKAQEFAQEPPIMSYHSLEYWFVGNESNKDDDETPAAHLRNKPPSREKMATVTFFVIWGQSQALGPLVARIPNLPAWFAQALTVFLIVALTTYIIMPIVTKYILHWWLFPDPNKKWYCFTIKTMDEEQMSEEPTTRKSAGNSTVLDGTEKTGPTTQTSDKQEETRDVESGKVGDR